MQEVDNVVDALVYYDWEPPEANISDANISAAYIESGFEESCESRGFETISGAVLMGRGLDGGDTAAVPTLPENYNLTYIGERSGVDMIGLHWNRVYGQGQMEGALFDNMYYPNQTQVRDFLIINKKLFLSNLCNTVRIIRIYQFQIFPL